LIGKISRGGILASKDAEEIRFSIVLAAIILIVIEAQGLSEGEIGIKIPISFQAPLSILAIGIILLIILIIIAILKEK